MPDIFMSLILYHLQVGRYPVMVISFIRHIGRELFVDLFTVDLRYPESKSSHDTIGRLANMYLQFTAVDHPALRESTDVVIFSTKGDRSPLSLLSGGDYDGDTVRLYQVAPDRCFDHTGCLQVLVIWDPCIVKPFRNGIGRLPSDVSPDFIERCFDREIKTAENFWEEIVSVSDEEKGQATQSYLLANLNTASLVGSYSSWCVYKIEQNLFDRLTNPGQARHLGLPTGVPASTHGAPGKNVRVVS